MKEEYIVALDQGTTTSRALLVDLQGRIKGMKQRPFRQHFPNPGWVEHDPQEILSSQMEAFHSLLEAHQLEPEQVRTIGITNQRETTVVWNRHSGKPVYNAIVWQDKRTASLCESLKDQGLTDYVTQRTGLVIDSYFSATKISWILDHVPGAREQAEKGELIFGTIDTWLIWNLSREQNHVTDYSNASRTMLFDITKLTWDDLLFEKLNIPMSMAPTAGPSARKFGDMVVGEHPIPIMGVAGDQQAALFGQGCFGIGDSKNTYGTGCFMLMNTGNQPRWSANGLLTTVAWGIDNEVYYALEGSIFIAGAAVQWLRDELKFFDESSASESLALDADRENPVYVVPAFSGLGAPYWDMYARGAIFGLSRDTGIAHITRATLDSLAYQTKDVLDAMQRDAGTELTKLKVDGGASANNYLMQFQADMLRCEVVRYESLESTAMGAAAMAAYAMGIWDLQQIKKNKRIEKVFSPEMPQKEREYRYGQWQKAISRTRNWIDPTKQKDGV